MKNFQILPKQQAFKLLKKLLAMDPKKRITSPDALKDAYFRETPHSQQDVFSCFDKIPFPLRQYLPKKIEVPIVNNKVVNHNAHFQPKITKIVPNKLM